jgi:hypothetical protein
MSAFSTHIPSIKTAEAAIQSGNFWPPIIPPEIRAAQRIDGGITPERLHDALVESVANVTGQLSDWRAAREAEGKTTLDDVPAETIDQVSILEHRYRRAVGCMAKAIVLERYRDYDSSNQGDKKADATDPAIDDLRRDAAWAIRDIQGLARTTVELI